MGIARPRVVFCRVQSERSAAQPAALLIALALALGLSALVARGVRAEPETEPTPAPSAEPNQVPFRARDSHAWQAHFEAWIETMLIEPELRAAAQNLRPPDPGATLRVLAELSSRHTLEIADPTRFPPLVEPRVVARGLSGAAIEAAREYAKGDVKKALAEVDKPELLGDPDAAHFRAQLIDERTQEKGPRERLRAIDEYRFALSLSRDVPQAARARVRIAQIYLEIGFLLEAAASLRPHLDPPLPRPYDIPAALTFAEAGYQAKDYTRTLATLQAIPPDALLPPMRPWVQQRLGDAHFALRAYPRAIEQYSALRDALKAGALPPIAGLRLGYALIQEKRFDDAVAALEPVFAAKDSSPIVGLAGVLLARAHAERNQYTAMRGVALDTVERFTHEPAGALGGTYLLEAERLGAGDARSNTVKLSAIIDYKTSSPEVGLLSARFLRRSRSIESLESAKGLGLIARSLPPGPVHTLVHDELTWLLLNKLVARTRVSPGPTSEVVNTIESELTPRSMEENGLLITLQTLQQMGHLDTCVAWSKVLRDREVRPIRRGLGAWREMQCTRESELGDFGPNRMLTVADNGDVGPFSLAFAALAAESLVERGDMTRAVLVYERALESFAEPQILGPVLLRVGELHAAMGRDGLAMRRLVRGMTITDSDATAADPFRKAGMVTLAHIAAHSDRTQRYEALAKRERGRVEPWWTSAYDYLGYRMGVASPPEGDDPFANAAAELKRAEAMAARLREAAKPDEVTQPTPAEAAP
jgi:tetratricopeptide (TPR) repeat protein